MALSLPAGVSFTGHKMFKVGQAAISGHYGIRTILCTRRKSEHTLYRFNSHVGSISTLFLMQNEERMKIQKGGESVKALTVKPCCDLRRGNCG